MSQYRSPGVYVEEVDSGPRPIEGVSTSIAGAVGVTQRGPIDRPILVTSFKEFQDSFGGYLKSASKLSNLPNSQWWNLPNAIQGFFANGGSQIFVKRVVGKNASTASLQPADAGDGDGGDGTTPSNDYGLSPNSPGTWGASLKVLIKPKDVNDQTVDLSVTLLDNKQKPVVEEEIVDIRYDLSDPADREAWNNKINRSSKLLTATDFTAPFPAGDVELVGTGGNDDLEAIDLKDFESAFESLETHDEISTVFAPGICEIKVIRKLLEHCEKLKYRFAIFEAPIDVDNQSVPTFRDQLDSKYAAIYYPWINVNQPGETGPIPCPPSGHIAGLYADVDTRRGVHKPPANEVIRGIDGISSIITKAHQDLLNPKGINALRFFPGRGNRVWGARTISSDTNFKYVNVRRIFNFIERSIDEGTQWVVFEPNNQELWSRVRQSVSNFLNTQWRAGALEGAKPEDAYFVACDRGTTMTQDDIENGRLIVEVGIAPVYPAEFVIFRVQKYVAASKLA